MGFWDNAAENVEQAEKNNGGFEIVPAGLYTAVIADAEGKENKARTGSYVNLKIEITGPTHSGRVLFEKLNLFNPSDKAVEIAVGTLGKICRSVHADEFYDGMKKECISIDKAKTYLSADRIWNAVGNRPVSIKVDVKEGQGEYGPENVIKAWKQMGDAPAAAPAGKPAKKPF